MDQIKLCPICGCDQFSINEVLWSELIDEWNLSPYEACYINRQQGCCCCNCGNNLRSLAIARAILTSCCFGGTLIEFVEAPESQSFRVLEINEAGGLTPILSKLPLHRIVRYPASDINDLKFESASFDIVIHSDTLEHIPDPISGLIECYRVLDHGGVCIFTVPLVIGRLSRSRVGMKESFHGSRSLSAPDYRVYTEFGADAWKYVIEAGFTDVRICSLEYPSAFAITAIKFKRDLLKDEVDMSKLESTGERFLPEWGGQSELEHLHRYLFASDTVKGLDVLDIASGEGYGTYMLSLVANKVIGVDIALEAVCHADQKYQNSNLKFVAGSCTHIPLANACVDVVVSFETIEHHCHHDQMMAEIKRVLRPGGCLIISSPDKENYSSVSGQDNVYHAQELCGEDFKKLIYSYFDNVRFLGQRVVYGSCIVPARIGSELVNFRKNENDIVRAEGLDQPIFWIAVASDGAVPNVPAGLFENLTDGIDRLKKILSERDLFIRHLQQTVDECNGQIDRLSQIVADRDSQVASLCRVVTELDGQVAALDQSAVGRDDAIANLCRAVAERDETIQAIRTSNSWKVTEPLRKLVRILGAKR